MIYAVTYVDVEPDFTQKGIELLERYAGTSRGEEGNSGIELLQEMSRQNRLHA